MNIELLLLLFVIILAIIYAAKCKTANGARLMTVGICVVILILFIVIKVRANVSKGIPWYEGFTSDAGYIGYSPLNYNMGKCSGYDLSNKPDIHPVYKNYDGLILKSEKRPELPLVSDVTIFSPVGDGIKLTEDPISYSFNTVDGKSDSPKHMFMLANNQVSWDCCPSTFSSDMGCVCLTKNQIDMVNKRQGNRSTDLYPGI